MKLNITSRPYTIKPDLDNKVMIKSIIVSTEMDKDFFDRLVESAVGHNNSDLVDFVTAFLLKAREAFDEI